MSLERRQNVAVCQAREAVQKAQARSALEPVYHRRTQRVVKIEENGAIPRESVREQRLARAELVLGVMWPDSVFADRGRGHNRSVPVAITRQIDDGEKVAVLAVLVTGPGEQISRWRTFRSLEDRRRRPRAGEGDDDAEGEWERAV